MGPNLREQPIQVNGLDTRLLETGPEDASEAVVFVHGNPGSAADWRDLASRAGEFTRCVAFDMPGFGRATKRGDFDYSVHGYGRFLGAALRQLGIQRVHLVAHDFGGPWSWAWASLNTGMVASIVAMNSGMLSGRKWHRIARTWRAPVRGELAMVLTTKRLFVRGLTANGAVRLPGEFVDRLWADFDWRTRRAVLRLYRATDLPLAEGARWVSTFAALDPPTLLVFGEQDPAVPTDATVKHMKRAFPTAEIERLPRSGHFPFADDPEGTAQAVIPFLRGQVRVA